jgi:hypothetical protein
LQLSIMVCVPSLFGISHNKNVSVAYALVLLCTLAYASAQLLAFFVLLSLFIFLLSIQENEW